MFASLFLRFLNWEASLARNNPGRIIESLEPKEGQTIADIGSGGGYFTLLFAGRVGKIGKVYAVDIEPKYLDFIDRQSRKKGWTTLSSSRPREISRICLKAAWTWLLQETSGTIFPSRKSTSAISKDF